MTKAGAAQTTSEGVLIGGLGLAALLYLPALLHYENYTVSIYYHWWTTHLWVEGVWEMIQGGFLAYLLIRLRRSRRRCGRSNGWCARC